MDARLVGKRWSRASFLKATGAVAALTALQACAPAEAPTTPPQATTVPTTAPPPTATSAPAPTPIPATPVPTKAPVKLSVVTVDAGYQFGTGTQLMWKEWEKRTGVSFDWKVLPGEKMDLLFQTGDARDVDIICHHRTFIRSNGPGNVLPLDDLIKEHGPNIARTHEVGKLLLPPQRAPDGKLYMAMGWADFIWPAWVYRKDLAEKYGFLPKLTSTNAHLDDWAAFVKAVQKDDPKAAVGIGGLRYTADTMKAAFGLRGNLDWMSVVEGKIVDWSTHPRARQLVEYVRKWFADGILDRETLSMPAGEGWGLAEENFKSGRTVFACAYGFYLAYTEGGRKNIPNFELAATIPPLGPDGRVALAPTIGWNAGGQALGTKCKDPVAAIRAIDYLHSDEGKTLYWLGVEGVTFEKVGDSYRFLDKVKAEVEEAYQNKTGGVSDRPQALAYLYGVGMADAFWGTWRPAPGKLRDAYVGFTEPRSQFEAAELSRKWLNNAILRPVFTESEIKEIEKLNPDISTYREESLAKLLSLKVGMDEWDRFVSQMKRLGITRMEEIYNTAYERTYNKKPELDPPLWTN